MPLVVGDRRALRFRRVLPSLLPFAALAALLTLVIIKSAFDPQDGLDLRLPLADRPNRLHQRITIV
jgi:hypothetical protein